MDYTFNPVVKPTTIHMVLSVALSKLWRLHQLNFKNVIFTWESINGLHALSSWIWSPIISWSCRCNKKICLSTQKPTPLWYQNFTNNVATMEFFHDISYHSLFIYQHGHDITNIYFFMWMTLLFPRHLKLWDSIIYFKK